MKTSGYTKEKYNFSNRLFPMVHSRWSLIDRFGAMKVRWGIHRNSYRIQPGLYALGNPDSESPVYVTGNYKLSFDHLRTSLPNSNGWILSLDTKGINVWCAAGKGTFGTRELVSRIETTDLANIVSHRKLILPQLGAPGIAAHQVKALSGFQVIYVPVYAKHLIPWQKDNNKNNPAYRTVRFSFYDRLILTGVEMVVNLKYLAFAMSLLLILSGINPKGYSMDLAFERGMNMAFLLSSAYLTGTLLVPLALPYIPFRAFSMKGAVAGLFIWTIFSVSGIFHWTFLEHILWASMITAVTSFLSMNFTGSSPITNLSGVLIEVKIAVPFQIGFAAVFCLLYVINLFIHT